MDGKAVSGKFLMVIFTAFVFCMLSCPPVHGQTDTTDYTTVTPKADTLAVVDTEVQMHFAKKASRLSAILPGLGQAYNKKYWKIPIIYGALGTSTYFIIKNNKDYQKYRNAYIARTDNDSTTFTTIKYTTDNIRLRRDFFRRNMELSIIITAGIYVLNIVDAAVDAHLFYFDVTNDLSMRIEPQVNMNTISPDRFNGGLKLSLYF